MIGRTAVVIGAAAFAVSLAGAAAAPFALPKLDLQRNAVGGGHEPLGR